MHHNTFEKKRLKVKQKRLTKEGDLLKKYKWHHIRDLCLLFLFIPVILPLHLGLVLYLACHSKSQSSIISYYLKYFFKLYFYFTGLYKIEIVDIPKTLSKPTIFFTIRNSELITPYLSTLFNYTIALPYQYALARFPIHPFLPIIHLGHFIKSFGYVDQDLEQSIKAAHHLLKQNIPVVLFINPKFINPMTTEQLPIYKNILEILDSSIDCYFLACKGFEARKTATYFRKAAVNIHCVPANDLLEHVQEGPDKLKKSCLKIMRFFEFRSVTLK